MTRRSASRWFLCAVFGTALACGGDKDAATPAQPATKSAADDASAGGEEPSDPAAQLPEAAEILARAVDAVGGKAKLDAVHSFYFQADVSVLGQNIAGNVKVWWKDGDFYTTNEMIGVGQIQAGKQGDVIWSEDPINGLRRLGGIEAEQHMWASSLMLFSDWQSYFDKAETIGQREFDGKKVYDVKLTSASGAEVTMTFDAESGLQVAQEFESASPMGNMPVKVSIEDYRDVDGIKIAFKHVTDASLAKATQTITEIQLNPEVDTSRFAMPTGGAELVEPPKKQTMMPFDEDGKPGKPVPQ